MQPSIRVSTNDLLSSAIAFSVDGKVFLGARVESATAGFLMVIHDGRLQLSYACLAQP